MNYQLIHGDCLTELKKLPSDSVDALVTDPPAGIGFMGKDWDGDKGGSKEWVSWMEQVMRECLRVMKPGAHGLVWAIPRTSHWTGMACEWAGFEVRDVVTHLFGSGFPKSYNIGQAMEKMATTGMARRPDRNLGRGRVEGFPDNHGFQNLDTGGAIPLTTEDAKRWAGWGTALKPAAEFWWLVRKPISEKNVAANVLKWGCGGLNIDGCRIGSGGHHGGKTGAGNSVTYDLGKTYERGPHKIYDQGRFPANLVLSGDAPEMLDAQSGTLKSGGTPKQRAGMGYHGADGGLSDENVPSNSGGASRFFYCAKTSTAERNAGCEGMPDRVLAMSGGAAAAAARGEAYERKGSGMNETKVVKNHHPTVKPQKLMRYLCRLITPPGGVVLDPFMGSGSTGVAAKAEGFGFIGIEREQEYQEIARRRIEAAHG